MTIIVAIDFKEGEGGARRVVNGYGAARECERLFRRTPARRL